MRAQLLAPKPEMASSPDRAKRPDAALAGPLCRGDGALSAALTGPS
jgi:hypothetical protein